MKKFRKKAFTCLVKHFRSDWDSPLSLRLSKARNLLGFCRLSCEQWLRHWLLHFGKNPPRKPSFATVVAHTSHTLRMQAHKPQQCFGCSLCNSYGFTLAETLITVVILGIVAVIVVPNLINRQVENANRTKVKKAMAAYEKAINYIIIENDIRTTEGISQFAQDDDCESARGYFKVIQKGSTD